MPDQQQHPAVRINLVNTAPSAREIADAYAVAIKFGLAPATLNTDRVPSRAEIVEVVSAALAARVADTTVPYPSIDDLATAVVVALELAAADRASRN